MTATLLRRLQEEADLCRNEGSTDIAVLLDEVAAVLAEPAAPAVPSTTITWTPVAERLPDDDITVMIALADGEVVAGWKETDCWFDSTGWQIDADSNPVTHWADLPAAPEAKP